VCVCATHAHTRRYYSPNYSQTLLEKLDGYQIPA